MMAFGMTDIADKVQDFLVYLKYEKQYSSATLKNYSLDLIKFITYLKVININMVSQINIYDLKECNKFN